jgi:hypothetical protein
LFNKFSIGGASPTTSKLTVPAPITSPAGAASLPVTPLPGTPIYRKLADGHHDDRDLQVTVEIRNFGNKNVYKTKSFKLTVPAPITNPAGAASAPVVPLAGTPIYRKLGERVGKSTRTVTSR